jgi:hypothetical protein
MGKFQQAVRKAHAVDERLKNLVEVTDELFARIKEHFSNPQLVERPGRPRVNPLDFSGSGAAHRAR